MELEFSDHGSGSEATCGTAFTALLPSTTSAPSQIAPHRPLDTVHACQPSTRLRIFLYTSADERPRSSGYDSSKWYCPEPKYARNRQSTFYAKFCTSWPANSWPKSYGHSSANQPRESSDGNAQRTRTQSYCSSISQPHGTATISTAAPDDHPTRSELCPPTQPWWKPPLRWPNASSARNNAIWCEHHATSPRHQQSRSPCPIPATHEQRSGCDSSDCNWWNGYGHGYESPGEYTRSIAPSSNTATTPATGAAATTPTAATDAATSTNSHHEWHIAWRYEHDEESNCKLGHPTEYVSCTLDPRTSNE